MSSILFLNYYLSSAITSITAFVIESICLMSTRLTNAFVPKPFLCIPIYIWETFQDVLLRFPIQEILHMIPPLLSLKNLVFHCLGNKFLLHHSVNKFYFESPRFHVYIIVLKELIVYYFFGVFLLILLLKTFQINLYVF